MKKILLVITLVLTLFVMGCGEDATEWTVSDYSPSANAEELNAVEALSNTIVYTPDENPIDDYFDYYIGDVTLLEGITDYVYFTSAETSVAEAGVFKVADKATADALLSAFDTRAENLAATYENYSPEDTQRAKDMKKGAFDDIVWFVASSDNNSVISAIEK